jgi:lipid-binding SYLF domain-containing protein
LQAGAKTFGYALFFMNESALAYLDKAAGFQLGVGPSLVVLDSGAAASLTSASITEDIYAFVYNQAGLMGGLGIEGSKITKINKK